MQVINSKFRTIKLLEHNPGISSYLVADIKNNNQAYQFNTINEEYIKLDIISNCINEFMSLKNLDTSGMKRIHHFGIINNIDNKRYSEEIYYYTSDYYENIENIKGIISTLSFDEGLDIIMEVCKSVNYIHLMEKSYGALNLQNILLRQEDNKYKSILQDIVTANISRYLTNDDIDYLFIPKKQVSNIYKDIYGIGVLILCVLNNGNIDKVKRDLRYIQENSSIDFKTDHRHKVLYDVAFKIINLSHNKLDITINNIIDYINLHLNKNYSKFEIDELSKLNFNIDLVGREDITESIFETYNSFKNGDSLGKVLLVHGSTGIGKTALLRNIAYKLRLMKGNVFEYISLNNNFKELSDAPLVEILKQMVIQSPKELVDKYIYDLDKLVPGLIEKEIVATGGLVREEENLRLITRIAYFINDFAKKQSIVIVIDNLQRLNKLSLMIIESLLSLKNRNILFIGSYSDNEYSNNSNFGKLFLNKESNFTIKLIELSGLNLSETREMIYRIINSRSLSDKLLENIYESTKGNPLFISEIIKNIFNNDIITINENGEWIQSSRGYKQYIFSNMDQIVLSQINNINEYQRTILNDCCIFKDKVDLNILYHICDLERDIIESEILRLIAQGIIYFVEDDSEKKYRFFNTYLKDTLYKNIPSEIKCNKHFKIAIIVEGKYSQGNEDLIDEVIYHFDGAKDRENTVKYLMIKANKLIELRKHDEAIKVLNIANYKQGDFINEVKFEILAKLGELYYGYNKMNCAISIYSRLQGYLNEHYDSKYMVEALSMLANIYMWSNDMEKAEDYIEKAEVLAEQEGYIEPLIEIITIKANLYFLRQRYKELQDICDKALVLCGDKYEKQKCDFYNIRGLSFLERSMLDKSIGDFEECLKFCELTQNTSVMIRALNNLGVVYGDFYGDIETAMYYYKMASDESKSSGRLSFHVCCEYNRASYYYIDNDIHAALEILKGVMHLVEEKLVDMDFYYGYLLICNVNLKCCNYREAQKYFKRYVSDADGKALDKRNLGEVFMQRSYYYFCMGDIESSFKFIEEALVHLKVDKSCIKWQSLIYKEVIGIALGKDINDAVEKIKDTCGFITSINQKVSLLSMAINELISKDEFYKARELFSLLITLDESKINKMNNVWLLYLKGVFEKDVSKAIEYLNSCLETSNEIEVISIKWKAAIQLAKHYSEEKRINETHFWYINAFEIMKKVLKYVPDEYKVSYAKRMPMQRVFDILYNDKEANLNNLSDINRVLKLNNKHKIMRNPDFLNYTRNIYNADIPEESKSLEDVILNLGSNETYNMHLINSYISYISLASRAIILFRNYDDNYEVLACSRVNKDISNIIPILERCENTKEVELRNLEDTYINKYLCIPILMEDKDMRLSKDKRSRKGCYKSVVVGHIYMETDRLIDSFDKYTINQCKKLSKVIGIIIDGIRLKHESSIDKLTGAYTRKYLESNLKQYLQESKEVNSSLSIVMVDLDRFRNINDTYGHQAGDKALHNLSRLVLDNIRYTDTLGRYGGEEFVIILPNTNAEEAYIVAEKLRRKIASSNILSIKQRVTCSMGVASYPEHGLWMNELFSKADKALYLAKEQGRNKTLVWKEEYDKRAKRANKFSGIITDNKQVNENNMQTLVELLNLPYDIENKNERLVAFLDKVLERVEGETITYFRVSDKKIDQVMSRNNKKGYSLGIQFDQNLIINALEKGEGTYTIDWNNVSNTDKLSGVPLWKSIMLVPIKTLSNSITAILYLTVDIKDKEFNFEDFNLVQLLSRLLHGIG